MNRIATKLSAVEWLGFGEALAIASDGSVSESGGCNRFHGSLTIEGARVSVGPLASARRMGPKPSCARSTATWPRSGGSGDSSRADPCC